MTSTQPTARRGRPAVFLDRDGTLIEEVGYATRPEDIRILGGVAGALRRLADAGYRLIVVTNQSAIARGYATEEDLERFHEALDQHLQVLGAGVDAYYACPHHPDPGPGGRPDLAVECECRKPKPGLILRAADDFHIDLAASWTVGDTWRDIAAGQAAGTRTVKLPADPDHDAPRPPEVAPPTAEARSLAEAADIILVAGPSVDRPPAAEAEATAAPAAATEESGGPIAASEADIASEADTADRPATAEAGVRERPGSQPPPAPAPSPPPRTEKEPPAAPATAASGEGAAAAAAPWTAPPGMRPAGPPAAPSAPASDDSREGAGPAPRSCDRCGRQIPPADLATGAAAERDGFLLCPDCLGEAGWARAAAPAGTPAAAPGEVSPPAESERTEAPPTSTEALLREMLAELRRLRRTGQPPAFSAWRILAYLVQAGAVFFGFGMALMGPEAERGLYLQVALLLQLLVLALLLFEGRS